MKNWNWNWLDKPITWRTSLRVSAISMAISLLGYTIYYAIIFWDDILDKLDEVTNLVKSKRKLG